jgi:hypothetical protein
MGVLDLETTTDANSGQIVRFGVWQGPGCRYDQRVELARSGSLTREDLDELWREIIFYNPAICTDEEIAAIKAYAATNKIGQGLIGSRPIEDSEGFQAYAEAYGIDVATEVFSEQTSARRIEAVPLDKFIDVFYKPCWVKWAKDPKDRLKEKKLIIGQNLPFDVGGLSTRAGLSHGINFGGFTMKLCRCSKKFKQEAQQILDRAATAERVFGVRAGMAVVHDDVSKMFATKIKDLDEAAANAFVEEAAKDLVAATAKKQCWHQSIVIKKYGFAKHAMKVHAEPKTDAKKKPDKDGADKKKKAWASRYFEFVDVMQLARA